MMVTTLTLVRVDERAACLAARSASWDLTTEDARLVVGVAGDRATVLGAFERADSPGAYRRGSGGGAALVEPGTVWVQLALKRCDVLVPCTADKLLNRYVRPLLRALTKVTGVPVNYFGRDWVSAAHRPVGLVGFAHDAGSGRCLFEAIVGVGAPPALAGRSSFLGKEPAALTDVAKGAKKAVTPEAVAAAVVDAYATIASGLEQISAQVNPAETCSVEPPWFATCEESIGLISAGPDARNRFRIGGVLMASRDAVDRLEVALQTASLNSPVGPLVDVSLGREGAVVFGVRSFASIRDVVENALRIWFAQSKV
jgi:hypothetical protein